MNRSVVVAIAYRDSVDRYLAATDAAGIESRASTSKRSRCCGRCPCRPRGGVSPPRSGRRRIGHELTTLAISDGRACQFTRVLDWGG